MRPAGTKLRAVDDAARAVPPCRHEQVFPGCLEQVGASRRFLAGLLAGTPVADDAVFCVSELAANCVTHSSSGQPGGTFTVRVEIRAGDYIWLEVAGGGGVWQPAELDGRQHGLEIIGQLASDAGVAGRPVYWLGGLGPDRLARPGLLTAPALTAPDPERP